MNDSPTNTDLAVQIAKLDGKVDGMIAVQAAQMEALRGRFDDSQRDRTSIHGEIERRVLAADAAREEMWAAVRALQGWRNKAMGAGWLGGVAFVLVNLGLGLYAVLHR
jgi:hypothetical protein